MKYHGKLEGLVEKHDEIRFLSFVVAIIILSLFIIKWLTP